MSTAWLWGLGHLPGWLLLATHVALQVFFVGRALLRPHREPASRLAWVVVIIVAPVVGMLAYVLFGETNIGRRRIARFKRAMARLPSFAAMSRHEGEARAEADIAAALQAAVPRRPVDLRLPAGRRQPRPAARRLRRRHRPHRRRHRRRPRPRPHLLLHLARRPERPEGRRRPEARRRARRHLPGDGRRPRQPRHGPLRALAGHGGGRRPPRRGAADRLPAVAPAQGPHRHAQPPQDRGRSTTASPTAARTTAPTPPSRSSRASLPGSTR